MNNPSPVLFLKKMVLYFCNMDTVKFNKDNLFQQIKASYLDDSFELTPQAKEKKNRLRHIFSLRLRNKYSRHQVIELTQKEYGISQSTAYRDYNWAMQLFGELDKTDKNAERMVLAEAYWQLYQVALKNKDIEQARKALDSYRCLFNFDDSEVEIDPNKIQAHEYHIHISRESSKVLRQALRSGVVDLNNVQAQEIEYEEMNQTETEDET